MPSTKPQVKVYVTEQQWLAVKHATLASGMTPSEARREALRMLCEAYGIEWVDDMPNPGISRSTTAQNSL
jgi:hypothetical protein